MARSSTSKKARPEVLAFLKDIKEHPEDDVPRSILADWLEEHGDPRGELVRLQCQRALEGGSVPGAAERQRREAELLTEHQSAWLGVLGIKTVTARFQRGLVEVEGSVRYLLSKRLASGKAREELAWVDGLTLTDLEAGAVADLVACPHWSCLNRLNLSRNGYYSTYLGRPPQSGLMTQGAVALARLPTLPYLTELNLRQNDIGADGLAALTASSGLDRLRVLNLERNDLRDEGVAVLTHSSLPNLTRLYLAENSLYSQGIKTLAGWPGLGRLSALGLRSNFLADGARTLAASPYLGNLRELNLRTTVIEAEGAVALSQSPSLRQLTSLDLEGNRIGPRGATALAHSPVMANLVELDLGENEIGDAGAVALASSPYLGRLVTLDLRRNGIGEEGARALAASPHLASLRKLCFRANSPSEPALQALQERFGNGLL